MAKASKVYIAHARSDAEIAQRLSRGLVDHAFDLFQDVDSIEPGENWAKEIGDALENADAMVVLLSPPPASGGGGRKWAACVSRGPAS